jgi:hypothetical protein
MADLNSTTELNLAPGSVPAALPQNEVSIGTQVTTRRPAALPHEALK